MEERLAITTSKLDGSAYLIAFGSPLTCRQTTYFFCNTRSKLMAVTESGGEKSPSSWLSSGGGQAKAKTGKKKKKKKNKDRDDDDDDDHDYKTKRAESIRRCPLQPTWRRMDYQRCGLRCAVQQAGVQHIGGGWKDSAVAKADEVGKVDGGGARGKKRRALLGARRAVEMAE